MSNSDVTPEWVTINGAELYVEVIGRGANKPVLIAHHGGGGIGSFHEPKATFGPLADLSQVVVFDARGCGISKGEAPFSHKAWADDVEGLRKWMGVEQIVVAGPLSLASVESTPNNPTRVSIQILG